MHTQLLVSLLHIFCRILPCLYIQLVPINVKTHSFPICFENQWKEHCWLQKHHVALLVLWPLYIRTLSLVVGLIFLVSLLRTIFVLWSWWRDHSSPLIAWLKPDRLSGRETQVLQYAWALSCLLVMNYSAYWWNHTLLSGLLLWLKSSTSFQDNDVSHLCAQSLGLWLHILIPTHLFGILVAQFQIIYVGHNGKMLMIDLFPAAFI